MRLEMLRQFTNPCTQDRDLHLGRTGVGRVSAVLVNQSGFFLWQNGRGPLYWMICKPIYQRVRAFRVHRKELELRICFFSFDISSSGMAGIVSCSSYGVENRVKFSAD